MPSRATTSDGDASRSGCAINAAVEALGDQWSLLVLRDIIFGDRRYFRELLAASEENIVSTVLADRLKRLVAAGLLTRADAARGQRALYSLTEAGIRTLPIIYELGNWGLDWRTGTPELRARQEVMRAADPGFLTEFADELRARHLDMSTPTGDSPPPSEQLREAYEQAARTG